MKDYIHLANGRRVPRMCVDALNEFEMIWPGATFSGARAAIVFAVLEAFEKFEKENAKNKVSISEENLLNIEPDLITIITEDMRKTEKLMGKCKYKKDWLDEVGDVWVCIVHGQVSRHHIDHVNKNEGSYLPCLAIDPRPSTKENNEQ